MEESPQAELGPFQLAVFVLSVFVLVLLAIELVLPLDPEVVRLATWADHAVCVVLFTDFVVRFRKAPSKLEFMRWGWIDLLASVPPIEALRWGRALRVLRVLRLIRAVRSLRAFLSIVFRSRATGGLTMAATFAFLTLSLASLGILVAERGAAKATIHTAEDAVWWSLATVTTVGYGDVYPVSGAGRVIAGSLMVVGVGLFGTLSGAVASIFLGPREAARRRTSSSSRLAEQHAELEAMRSEVAALRAQLAASRGAARSDPDATSHAVD